MSWVLGQRVEGDSFFFLFFFWEREKIKGEPVLDSVTRAGGCEDLGLICGVEMLLFKCMGEGKSRYQKVWACIATWELLRKDQSKDPTLSSQAS